MSDRRQHKEEIVSVRYILSFNGEGGRNNRTGPADRREGERRVDEKAPPSGEMERRALYDYNRRQ